MGKIVINTLDRRGRISRNIYGGFSEHLGRCVYNGLFVGEDSEVPNVNGMRADVVEALKNIRLPVLRWPGGCFADEYHWKDGVGPKEGRKRMVNTHWGGVVEDNSFGTHEFMELCRQVGCEPYVNGNVGSGTVREMSEWVEYMTFDGVSPMAELREQNGRREPWRLKYLGVGNESWGCGGNMRPEYYADLFRRYQTYCRNYGDNKLFKIACGPNSGDYDWTDKVMEIAGGYADGLSLHYYTVPSGNWEDKGAATGFTRDEYYATLRAANYMEELVTKHSQIMDRHDPSHKVGLIVDEWGTWYNVEPGTNPGFLYQQNTMRDAMVAALTLNIFNRHCDRVVMANIAQLVNVLQALVLTEGDRMVLTPTYHVFDLYQCHQDGTLLGCFVQAEETGGIGSLSVSASMDSEGAVHITAANLDPDAGCPVEAELLGKAVNLASGRLLAGEMGAFNDFGHPHDVEVTELGPIENQNGRLRFTLPPCSVAEVAVK